MGSGSDTVDKDLWEILCWVGGGEQRSMPGDKVLRVALKPPTWTYRVTHGGLRIAGRHITAGTEATAFYFDFGVEV